MNGIEIIDITDIFITQQEYDKLLHLHQRANRIIRTTKDTPGSFFARVETRKKKYEDYRLELSDKYGFELLRADGSYFALEGLNVVYVLGGKNEFNRNLKY